MDTALTRPQEPQAVFTGVLRWLAEAGLARGTPVGIDATTLEASAALRSLVPLDSGEGYGVSAGTGHRRHVYADARRNRPTSTRSRGQRRLGASAGPDVKITTCSGGIDGRSNVEYKRAHGTAIAHSALSVRVV